MTIGDMGVYRYLSYEANSAEALGDVSRLASVDSHVAFRRTHKQLEVIASRPKYFRGDRQATSG
jgi:hypothetical protein